VRRLRTRITIWLLDHGWIRVEPWEDPRRSAKDRALWLMAQPKYLRRAG
jgi:hypothetical protein